MDWCESEKAMKSAPPIDTKKDYMLYLAGSKTSWRCECGCNVFRRTPAREKKYKCNSCGSVYVGE